MKLHWLLPLLAGCATQLANPPAPPAQDGQRLAARHARATVWWEQTGPQAPGAPALVLLHPWITSSRVWHRVLPALSREHRVISIDLPAHGRSSFPPGRYPPQRLAAAVADVLDAAGVEQAVLIGGSLGGAAAITLAERDPRRVRALVLIGSPGGDTLPELNRRLVELATSPHHLRQATVGSLAFGWWYTSGAPEGGAVVLDELLALRLEPSWPARAQALSSALFEVLRFEPKLSALTVPVLVVQGDDDRVVRPRWGAALAEALPAGTLARLPDCGHFPMLECPEAFLQAVLPFLRAHGDPR
jgi:pimeloyl-ACP methyl ester carboxylesterase